MNDKKIAVISLGCNKNLVDAENMLGLLGQEGYKFTSNGAEADILLVNTCGFIESAKEESIQAILEFAKYKKNNNSKLIVTGCLAQRYPNELIKEMPEIDGLVGIAGIVNIATVVKQVLDGKRVNAVGEPGFYVECLLPRLLSNPGQSAYVKIAEGCNNMCSYCAIPSIRGHYTSKPVEIIEQEVKQLVANGIKEIILVAQDTTRYGIDLYGEYRLPQLIKTLTQYPLTWLRILYCYPTYFSDQLIETIATEPKVCKYVDLPLQHASDKILKQMYRRDSITDIRKLITKLRQRIPNVTLRTSFIVGFPGEQEHDFQQLLDFIQEVKFERVGVFKYSQEEGTPAAAMPDQVDETTKEKRYQLAMEMQQQISLKKNQNKLGQIIDVLTEGEISGQPGTYVGRSQGDAPDIDGLVYFKAGRKIIAGELVPVQITQATEYDLIGVLSK